MKEIEKMVDMGDRLKPQNQELSLQKQLDKEKLEKEEIKKELIEAKEKFTQLKKIFLIISHDLRSPFNGLLGYLDLITEEINNNPDAGKDLKEQLEFVNKSANSLFTLTTNILSWAQNTLEGDSIELSEVKLSSEVEDVFSYLQINAFSKKIKLINDIGVDLTVFSNKEAINTILRNLISNAIKFTQQEGIIKVSSTETSSEIKIIVEDNGVGIESDRLHKLFNMTETTIGTNSEQGNGLGLYLCKEIIEKLGGNIKVESKIGQGTTFIVTLPTKEVKE